MSCFVDDQRMTLLDRAGTASRCGSAEQPGIRERCGRWLRAVGFKLCEYLLGGLAGWQIRRVHGRGKVVCRHDLLGGFCAELVDPHLFQP